VVTNAVKRRHRGGGGEKLQAQTATATSGAAAPVVLMTILGYHDIRWPQSSWGWAGRSGARDRAGGRPAQDGRARKYAADVRRENTKLPAEIAARPSPPPTTPRMPAAISRKEIF